MEKNIEFRSFCRFRDGKNIHTQKKPINWMRDVEILHIYVWHINTYYSVYAKTGEAV